MIELDQFNDVRNLTITLKILAAVCVLLIISVLVGAICIYNSLKDNNDSNDFSKVTSNDSNNESKNDESYIKKIDYNVTPTGIENVNNIYMKRDKKIAYITFDDGPSKEVTPLILQVLKEENVKATFFMLGKKVEKNPEIVKQVYREGHYVANHGYSHEYGDIYNDPQNVLDEYNHTERCLRNALGIPDFKSGLFRFPGGSKGGKYNEKKKEAAELLSQNNIAHVDWNTLTSDAVGTPTKESLIQSLQDTSADKNSIVVLMHDAQDKVLTYETLKEVIEYLKSQGYEIGDMHDVIGIENPLVDPNNKKSNNETNNENTNMNTDNNNE